MWTYLGTALAVLVGLLMLTLHRFIRSQEEALRKLRGGGQLAETDRGRIEYACVGEGPVVLCLHGGLGGWDQGIVIADNWLELVKGGFTVLAPSRPGYLRTPVETGETPEAAADAMVALLDALGIERVLVLGTSGGGPTALQFALRHPGRTRALVMLSAISGQHRQPGRTRKRYGWFLFSKHGAFLLDMGWWLINGMVKLFPRLMVTSMFRATTTKEFKTREEVDYVMTHPKALASLQDLMDTQVPLSIRKMGLDNDLEKLAELPAYPVEGIACPTLVVHGRCDGNVPFSHGELVADKVPGAKTYVVESGGHLLCAGPEAERMRSAIVEFLQEHSS